jgi:outer membrane protein
MEVRPELKALELRLDAAQAAGKAARGLKFPQIFLGGGYTVARPNQRIFPQEDEFNSTWDVGLTVSYDLWNWRATDHQIRQAETQAEKIRDALNLLRDAIRLEVHKVFLDLIKGEEKVIVADRGVVQARENLRITQERFAQGLVLNSEVLDAEVALLQASLQNTQALVENELTMADLDRILGR